MSSTPQRFGYEWRKYSHIDPNYEQQFRAWVAPLAPEDFVGKRVLDAGCGMGRNSYWALRWGCKEIVAFDYNEHSVAAARRNLAEFPNATVLFKSIYDIDWKDEFDIAFSVGVIHHLEMPKLAVARLADAVKPGGRVVVWLYGYEGNEWIVRYVAPIRRRITSRMPPGLLDFTSYLVSVPFYLALRALPVRRDYLRQLKTFRFRHLHSIIFDQLLPAIATHYTMDGALKLLMDTGLVDVRTYHSNNHSWTVIGTKAPS